MTCSKCQFQNPEGEVICQKCQAVIAVPPPPVAPVFSPAPAVPPSPPNVSGQLWFQKLWAIVLMAVGLGPLGLVIVAILHRQKGIRLPKIFWILLFLILILSLMIIFLALIFTVNTRRFASRLDKNLLEVAIPTLSPASNLAAVDSDNDGVPDDVEVLIGTNPNYQECSEFLTNPCGLITASVSGSDAVKNALIILDASGSMAEKISGKSKMDIARGVLGDYLKTLMDKGFKVGLMIYGHKGSNSAANKAISCAGIETVLPIGSSQGEISAALTSFSPTGWTPIGGSLTQAKDVLAGFTGQDNYVLLVSDGEETCGGDPVAAARSLKESDVKAVVDVIGFNVDTKTRTQLESVAAVGGGKFIFSADEAGFRQATAQIQAGLLTARSGLAAQICVAQEKHKLLACLYDFYYTKAQPKITGLRERNTLTAKYKEMEKKFDDLTAPFIQQSREAIQEGVKQIDEGQSGR